MDQEEYIYNCSICNTEVDANAIVCPGCGADLSETEYVNDSFSTTKVDGWLLFLCIVLTIISPLYSFTNVISVLDHMPSLMKHAPEFASWAIIDLVLVVGMMSYSIYAGTLLWKKKPGAVTVAKRYLIVFLIYSLVEAVIVLSFAKIEVGMDVVRSFIFVGIWYTYLIKSKRVKQTYPLDTTYFNPGEKEDTTEDEPIESDMNQHIISTDDAFKAKDFNIENYEELDDSGLTDEAKDKLYANLFELRGKITREDIRKRYKKLIELYHPDKVSHLGREFQIFAEKKTKDINKAYLYFKRKYNL